MKYAKYIAVISTMVLSAFPAMAAVTVSATPVSLVTSATSVDASSDEIALFSFALTETDDETLESVTITVNNASGSTATSDDLASVSVYKDDGDGSFGEDEDSVAGSESNVNVGSATEIEITSNDELDGDKFFVTLKTDGTWGNDEDDAITVNLGVGAIETSSDSPTIVSKTTAILSSDNDGPELTSAVAGKIGTSKVVVLTFDEATNKATINDSNIDDELALNNSHTWLSGDGDIDAASWNTAGTVLTVTLDNDTSEPTVAVSDTITVAGDVIEDKLGNEAMGSETITGNFSTVIDNGGECVNDDDDDCDEEEECDESDSDDDDCDDVDEEIGNCTNGLKNGRLYKLSGESNTTVYLAAACGLKPFRGAAAFHARGHKFQNIIELSSLSGLNVSTKPALPAGGTLIKGSDSTVWIVTKNGKRKGFVSENAFSRLGFKFGQVQQITDDDLNTMDVDEPVEENDNHPDGTVAKCGNSATVFEIKDNSRFPFTSGEAFELRGHSWAHIAVIDCGRFAYMQGSNQTEND